MNKNKYLSMVPVLGVALTLSLTVSAIPGHSYVSVHPSAFMPSDGGATGFYINDERLANNASSNSSFYAPVYHPQGATVTKLTLRFMDPENGTEATIYLERNQLDGTSATMAEVATSGHVTYAHEWSDSSIVDAVIDNSQYTYSLLWDSPAGYLIELRGVFIEYTYQTSLPAVLRNLISVPRGH